MNSQDVNLQIVALEQLKLELENFVKDLDMRSKSYYELNLTRLICFSIDSHEIANRAGALSATKKADNTSAATLQNFKIKFLIST